MPLIYLFSSQAHYHPHLLPSFPTRRSSDLILAPGGVLFTSSCSYHVSRDIFNAMLADAARDSGRRIQLLAATGASSDHPELLNVPETGYLKGVLLRAIG